MEEINITTVLDIKTKCLAIVRFGPEEANSGFTLAQYFQAVIDPERISPNGEYIRFGYDAERDELNGWQKASCIFVVEILEELGE